MRRGGTDPWAADYSQELAKAQQAPEKEFLIDMAKQARF
jgi:hypothetical protein